MKTMRHKTNFVALKRTIGASLNLLDPLARDGTNTGRRRDKIPRASALKCNLPFGVTHNIPIRNRLKDYRETIVARRVAIRWAKRPS
jgi:hypothetical protein